MGERAKARHYARLHKKEVCEDLEWWKRLRG